MLYAEELTTHPEEAPMSKKARRRQKRHNKAIMRSGSRRADLIRRGLGIALIMAMVWGVIWFFLYSGMGDPVLAVVGPWYEKGVAVVNDPLGVDWAGHWMMIAMIIVPHLGLIMFMLDEH